MNNQQLISDAYRKSYNRAERLLESWGDRIDLVDSVGVGGEPLSHDQKLVLAQCLQNTQEQIDLLEATDYHDTDGFKHFALDLVTAVIPNLVANDIVSIQPIDNSVGVINYIRYIYGSSKGVVNAGDEFASGILYTGSDTYYSSHEVVGEPVTLDKAQGTIKTALAWAPIIKGSLRIPVQYQKDGQSYIGSIVDSPKDGTLKLVDPATNEEVPELLTTGTIDYDSGQVDVKLTGLETNSQTAANYAYNNMSVGDGAIGTNALQVPEVDIRIDTLPVVCQSRKLKALYAFDAAFKLQKEYGADINALLNSQIASEIAHEIDGEIMNDLLRGAGLVNGAWNRERPIGLSLRDHYESFNTVLIEGSNRIFGATKRANATFIIVGLDVATVIESMDNFESAGVTGVIGPHICGTLRGLQVIKNPYYPPRSYVLGFKGMTLFDAGYFYCPYQPITTTSTIMADDFVGRRGWATSYAKKMVQPMLYCRGEIVDSQNPASGGVEVQAQ